MSEQPTQFPTLMDAIRDSLRLQNMTTPSNTNGNVDGDEDRGNWSRLGEMIGGSFHPTMTATTTSLPTASTNAENATTTKSATNRNTFPTAASLAWRPSVLAPAPPDSPQMSIITPLNSGASSTVDSSSGKRKDDSTPQNWRSILIGGPGPPPEIVNSPSGRATSITPMKHRQMPSVSTPESSDMGTGMDRVGGGGGGSDIEMSSPNGPGGRNGNGTEKSGDRTRDAILLIGRIEKPKEKNGESSKQIGREIIKPPTKTTQKNGSTLILSLAERTTATLQPQIQKPSSSPTLTSTPRQSRKSTPTTVQHKDVPRSTTARPPPERTNKRKATDSIEPPQTPQEGTSTIRISPRRAAIRAVAVDKEKQNHKLEEPSPAGRTRMEAAASTSTAAASVTPGAGPSTAKTKKLRKQFLSKETIEDSPSDGEQVEVVGIQLEANGPDASGVATKVKKKGNRPLGYVYIEEPVVKTTNSFEDITAQLDADRRHTRLAHTAVAGELQKPPCAQCVGSGGDCLRRAKDIPLSRRLELGKQHPNGRIPDFEFLGPCERCQRTGMSKTCSFVKSDGEGPSGETGYGVKRKMDAKMDYLTRPGSKARKKANTDSPQQRLSLPADSPTTPAMDSPSASRIILDPSRDDISRNISLSRSRSTPGTAPHHLVDMGISASGSAPVIVGSPKGPNVAAMATGTSASMAIGNGRPTSGTAKSPTVPASTPIPAVNGKAPTKGGPPGRPVAIQPNGETNAPIAQTPSSSSLSLTTAPELHSSAETGKSEVSEEVAQKAVTPASVTPVVASAPTAPSASASTSTPASTTPSAITAPASTMASATVITLAGVAPAALTRGMNPAAATTQTAIQTNGITPAVRQGGAPSPASTIQVPAIASTSAAPSIRPPALNLATATATAIRPTSPSAALVTSIKTLMGTLIEAYQAICFSSDFEATHRETVMALVTSWRHRNEREPLIRQIDYGPEMAELVEEVVGQIKRTVGENPPFVIEFLSKKAREDTDKILGLLELKERWSWSTL